MYMQPFGSILPIATMASRGGARRGPTPLVGAGALSDVFDEIATGKKQPFDFGIYEHLTRSRTRSRGERFRDSFFRESSPSWPDTAPRVEAPVRCQGLAQQVAAEERPLGRHANRQSHSDFVSLETHLSRTRKTSPVHEILHTRRGLGD